MIFPMVTLSDFRIVRWMDCPMFGFSDGWIFPIFGFSGGWIIRWSKFPIGFVFRVVVRLLDGWGKMSNGWFNMVGWLGVYVGWVGLVVLMRRVVGSDRSVGLLDCPLFLMV